MASFLTFHSLLHWVNPFCCFPFSIFSKNWSIALFDFCEMICVAWMRKSESLMLTCPVVTWSDTCPWSWRVLTKWIISIHLYFSSSLRASHTKDPSKNVNVGMKSLVFHATVINLLDMSNICGGLCNKIINKRYNLADCLLQLERIQTNEWLRPG